MVDINEEKIKTILESEDCSPEDFLVLSKMLCAKHGITNKEWEEQFHEQEHKEKLRQMGIDEYFVTRIVASSIRAKFDSGGGMVGHSIRTNDQNQLICSVCKEKPYDVIAINAWPKKGNKKREQFYIIVVLCESHIQRIERQDVKLLDTIVEGYAERHMNRK